MLKLKLVSILLVSTLLLSACGGTNQSAPEETNTPESNVSETNAPPNETEEPNGEETTNFEPGLLFDMQSYHDEISDTDTPALDTLERNLLALVEHNNEAYNADFDHENLIEALYFYYGENLQYRFTEIESIETNDMNDAYHITVLGERLDTTTGTVEEVKMMYSLGQNDQGDWKIRTID